jgi:CHAD domain-containing protein
MIGTSHVPVALRAPAGLARAAIAEQVKALLACAPAVIGGEGGEALHDLRVASRRLRAVVQAYAPIFPRKARAARAAELKALTDALGAAREWDVHVEGLEKERERAETPVEREALGWALGRARERREAEHRAMSLALTALGLEGLTARALALPTLAKRLDGGRAARVAAGGGAGTGEPLPPEADEMRLVARETLSARAADALEATRAAREAPPDDIARPHAARIAWKKVRYALEVLAPAFERAGDEAEAARERAHDLAKRIQDVLGKHHDRALLEDILAEGYLRLESLGLDALARGLVPAVERLQESQEEKRLEFLDLTEAPRLERDVAPALRAVGADATPET